jgi:hypothetical protein
MKRKCYHIRHSVYGLDEFYDISAEPDHTDDDVYSVILTYRSPGHEVIPLQRALDIIADTCSLPRVRINVTWRQLPSLSLLLVSYSFMMHNVSPPCFCHLISDEYKLDGHLLTTKHTWASAWPQL